MNTDSSSQVSKWLLAVEFYYGFFLCFYVPMNIPNGYDPITLNHWLWYKYQCHEGSAHEFQRLFENIFKRAKPEFIQIRPYGNIGDRKCDGLFYSQENSTVFQVYSPDELKQAEVGV